VFDIKEKWRITLYYKIGIDVGSTTLKTVILNEKKDRYEGHLSNLGVSNIEIHKSYIKDYEKLLSGGIW